MIQISNFSKTYAGSGVKAVDDVSFTVGNGEIFGFLGPNGAGKSTTIKCMTGILGFSDGNIIISGADIRENPVEAKKKIGFVPDEHVIYEGLTGMQYIDFIADVFGVETARRKELMDSYLPRFGMKDKITEKIASYSHGMKQKISLLAALVHEPEVFILDEPMTGLDPQSSYELKNIMAEYAAQGKTVFFSSHVLEVVEKVCTRVAIIDNGKLITICDMKELKEKRSDLSLEELFLNLTRTSEGKM